MSKPPRGAYAPGSDSGAIIGYTKTDCEVRCEGVPERFAPILRATACKAQIVFATIWHVTFQKLLQTEFDRRRASNPRYSLRAFARFLEMDHATLSQILRQRRRVTPRTVRTIGPRLRISGGRIEQMCALENDRAVLATIARESFRPDCRWIATVSGIPVDEVNLALHRLLHSGTLTMSSREYWHIKVTDG